MPARLEEKIMLKILPSSPNLSPLCEWHRKHSTLWEAVVAFTLSPATFALKGGGFYPSATPRRCKREEHMVLRKWEVLVSQLGKAIDLLSDLWQDTCPPSAQLRLVRQEEPLCRDAEFEFSLSEPQQLVTPLMLTSYIKAHFSQLIEAGSSQPTNPKLPTSSQPRSTRSVKICIKIWLLQGWAGIPWGPLLPSLSSIAHSPAAAAPQALSTAAGTAHSLLTYSSFIQMLSLNHGQGSESIHSALNVTSGKVKTSVQQSPCAFGHGDSSCAAAHCVGELWVCRGWLSPNRHQRHLSLPEPRQQNVNVGRANIVHPSLKLKHSPNNNFYIRHIKNIILQILVSHNLHIEFQGGHLMECVP